jgi:alanyl-tRNA synthetase
MLKQKTRSKKDSTSKVQDWVILDEKPQEFVGYDVLETETYITRYRKIENKDGEFFQIVLSKSPFYPEGGGQIGDKGVLINLNSKVDGKMSFSDIVVDEWSQYVDTVRIIDTKRENNLIVSTIKKLPKQPHEKFLAEVNLNKRKNTEANHSVTHLMHEALREVLGTHVEQKGSFVGSEYLRFDFSHFSKISEEDLQIIENKVNAKIRANIALQEFRNIPIKEAMEKGAMALFGEKYGDNVRMIQFGDSKELCGGTHVKSTAEIGFFKILSESSTAAGIRRIEAISGEKSQEYFSSLETEIKNISQLLKSKDVVKSVQSLLEENATLKSEVESFKKEKAKQEVQLWKTEYIGSTEKQLLVKKTSLDASIVKDLVFQLKKEIPNSITIILSDFDQKPMITVGVSADLESDFNAGNLVKDLAKEIQGGGGGNAGFATAGGKKLEGLESAFEKAMEL